MNETALVLGNMTETQCYNSFMYSLYLDDQ